MRFVKREGLASALTKEQTGKVALVKTGVTQSARLTEKFAEQLGIDWVPNAFTKTMSSDRRDRYKDIIRVPGWQLDNFTKAGGPLLFGHNSDKVIGHMPALWKQEGNAEGKNRLRGVAAFSKQTDLAREILGLVEEGQIRSGSVGFVPLEYDWMDDGSYGIDFKKQDLVEHSITATPANPDALIGKSADFPNYLRALEERIDLDLEEQEAKDAYLLITGKRTQVDTIGLDPLKGATKVTKEQWLGTLARIDAIEKRIETIEQKATKPADDTALELTEGEAQEDDDVIVFLDDVA